MTEAKYEELPTIYDAWQSRGEQIIFSTLKSMKDITAQYFNFNKTSRWFLFMKYPDTFDLYQGVPDWKFEPVSNYIGIKKGIIGTLTKNCVHITCFTDNFATKSELHFLPLGFILIRDGEPEENVS